MQISFANSKLNLLPEGLLWVEEASMMVLCDLQLEKASFLQQQGAVSLVDETEKVLASIENYILELQPKTVLVLGESLYDINAINRMSAVSVQKLNQIIDSVQLWLWVIDDTSADYLHPIIKGQRVKSYIHRGICFLPKYDKKETRNQIFGNVHPKIFIRNQKTKREGKCFVFGKRIGIMPSLCHYTGGRIMQNAQAKQFYNEVTLDFYMLSRNKIYSVTDRNGKQTA